ncbi:MAG: DUF4410 domain-containing protein [Paraburkholderia sp.]|uniref:DUF4410 domain-containing protein n=1 Tax=Paraburkholderia sp. TaxID=1926495 RepID=UPI003C64CB88
MLLRWLQPALLAASLAAITTASFAADSAPFPSPAPVVYVADFDLDVANVKPDSGPGSRLRRLGSALPSGPLRSSKDPQTHAKEVVADMADDLTDDLKKAGVDARRIAPDQPAPTSGWQIRGVFLSVDEGNRLQRAVVGLGAGQTDFQVAVSLDDLSTPNLPPLYQQTEEGTSKDKPGAVIKLNPYVVAAKFVMAGQDEKAAIKSTAKAISEATVEKLKARPQ